MNQPTIRERLNQIVEYEIPHIVRGGNGLSEKGLVYDVIGILGGRIPEVVINPLRVPENIKEWTEGIFTNGYNLYAESLSKASGGVLPKSDVGYDKGLYPSSLSIHSFYVPQTDMTHYFILPDEEIVKAKQYEQKMKEEMKAIPKFLKIKR
ncbi:MAG: hypothetical protein AABY14_04940 [Nanoarchaeota archaeon]